MQNTRREIEIIQKRIELSYEINNHNRNIIHEIEETLVKQIKNFNRNHEELNSRVNLIIKTWYYLRQEKQKAIIALVKHSFIIKNVQKCSSHYTKKRRSLH